MGILNITLLLKFIQAMGEAVRMTQTGTRGGYRYVANCFIFQILEGNEQSFVYNIFMT